MADQSAAWQQGQRNRAKTYKPKTNKSQIPGSYGCAGVCSQPAPPAPGADMEMFKSFRPEQDQFSFSEGNLGIFRAVGDSPTFSFWLVIGVAVAMYTALTLSKRAFRR